MRTKLGFQPQIHVTDASVLVHAKAASGYGVWLKLRLTPEVRRLVQAGSDQVLALIQQQMYADFHAPIVHP